MNQIELEERTLVFSKKLISTLRLLPRNRVNGKLFPQILSSGTSIGANYREANSAESKKDFQHKMCISFKEAKETRYWLDILIFSNPSFVQQLSPLRQESDELTKIFGKVVWTCKNNK